MSLYNFTNIHKYLIMEKTSREYAEKLAWEKYPIELSSPSKFATDANAEKRKLFIDTWLKAVEETNVKELRDVLEAICEKLVVTTLYEKSTFLKEYLSAINALNKTKS